MTKILQSAEAKALMAEHGWDQNIVCFGLSASEASVKLAMAMLVSGREHSWVTISFDDKSLQSTEGMDQNTVTPGSKIVMGVRSAEWKLLTAGRSAMPAIAIDGQMYMDSEEIVKMFAVEAKAPAAVMELIDFSRSHNSRLFETLKHFGWAAMHQYQGYTMVNREHYEGYGQGVMDEAWEKASTDVVKTFFGKLEATLAAKPAVNGFFVGDSYTYADACLCNWALSFSGAANLDVARKYPKVWANWQIFKSALPSGTEPFVFGFPMLVDYVTTANAEARAAGWDINAFWSVESGREYLLRQNVEKRVTDAVAIVLKERPADALARIAELISQPAD